MIYTDEIRILALIKQELVKRDKLYHSDTDNNYKQIMRPDEVLVMIAQIEAEVVLDLQDSDLPFMEAN